MDVKQKIKSYLQEAELYRSQGLLNEAKERYVQAGQLVKKYEADSSTAKTILTGIAKKIQDISEQITRIENAPTLVTMPEQVQNIIKEKFSFAENEESRALEGAIALAKFGQFERALKEFTELIDNQVVRVDAAKNIIRCHMALDTLEEAVTQYEQWNSGNLFTPEQMNKLRVFLQGLLDKKGLQKTLTPPKRVEKMRSEQPPELSKQPAKEKVEEFDRDGPTEIIDISSIAVTLPDGPQKGQTVEFDVSFQSGNVINLLISSSDHELIESLKTGLTLNDVQFFSPIAMFNGTGVITSKSKIESGPKKGDYSLDIKIKSI